MTKETIAIIGLSCRFPGAENLESFWQVLRDRFDAITEIPKDRWDVDLFYDAKAYRIGKMITRWGGFLKTVDRFDPKFFKISPREAIYIDPQQRLMLEVAWEALEDAGLTAEELSGSHTGVFVGVSGTDYGRKLIQDPNKISAFTGTGGNNSIAANRVSYFLDLQGPSIAVDTACSSSLVAVHLACQSLQNKESDLALAGGVNVILSPAQGIGYSQAQMMAKDGHCKTFDASADGFVRSEGCGVIVLKRLSDALRDRDKIEAIIKGSAVNQDGLSNGISAPNGRQQKKVIRKALDNAGVSAREISYLEAHGTGTSIGDPIEVNALKAVLSEARSAEDICYLGSVKTNIGHLETASGIAGLIKVVLSLKNKQIPANLHFQELNPKISLKEGNFLIATQLEAWQTNNKARLAGINSFGFGGTNAHVILEEAPIQVESENIKEPPKQILTLTAKSETALQLLANNYAVYLDNHPEVSLTDICFTANRGRSQFRYRLAAIASSFEELKEQLQVASQGLETPNLVSGKVRSQIPKIAFLFTGQGSQYVGMGRQLYQTQPLFRQILERCEAILIPYLEKPLLSVIYSEIDNNSLLDETAYTQPALFAFEYALARLWLSWGIKPDFVMGHSVGEYVAACIAGVFSLEDGLKLIAKRGELMQGLPRDGAMLAALTSEEKIQEIIAPYDQKINIAAINGPESIVISGETGSILSIQEKLEKQGINNKLLKVSHAFHSVYMEPILEPFEKFAETINYSAPQIPLISQLTDLLEESQIKIDAAYWRDHIRQPVRFFQAMEILDRKGCELFLEIGPHPILLGMGSRCLPNKNIEVWLPSLRKEQENWQQLLITLGKLFVRNLNLDWQRFYQGYKYQKISLPTYPFERDRYWLDVDSYFENHLRQSKGHLASERSIHPILGSRLHLALKQQIIFRSDLSLETLAYIKDHRVLGAVILPGAAYFEMALTAAVEVFKQDIKNVVAEDIFIIEPVLLPKHEIVTLQMVINLKQPGSASFEIFSKIAEGEDDWTLHVTGKISVSSGKIKSESLDWEKLEAEFSEEIAINNHYRYTKFQGLDFGADFQTVVRLKSHPHAWERIGQISMPDRLKESKDLYYIHPVLLDGCFQIMGGILNPEYRATIAKANENNLAQYDYIFLPAGLNKISLTGLKSNNLSVRAKITTANSQSKEFQEKNIVDNLDIKVITADLDIFDNRGNLIAKIEGIKSLRIKKNAFLKRNKQLRNCYYQINWQLQPRINKLNHLLSKEKKNWLIFCDSDQSIGNLLVEKMQKNGHNHTLVYRGDTYKKLQEKTYQVNPLAFEHFHQLFIDIEKIDRYPINGILHLWSLDSRSQNNLTIGDLEQAQSFSCGTLLHLVQAILQKENKHKPDLYIITQNAEAIESSSKTLALSQSTISSLNKVIELEYPGIHTSQIDLDSTNELTQIELLWQEITGDRSEEIQVAFRGDRRYVSRLTRAKLKTKVKNFNWKNKPYRLNISSRGILENLTIQPTEPKLPRSGEVQILVRATGLNFRDVLNAMGMYPGDPGPIGIECAGVITKVGQGVENLRVGDAVLAIAPSAFDRFAVTNAKLVTLKPTNLTFSEAATIPIAFLTAYYGLHNLAKITSQQRILIHSAAGGVGMAAIQLAKLANAEIFATASHPKWQTLRSLGIEHIMNSRTLDFADEVMKITDDRGVDIVFNSLSGEFITKSLSVLGDRGCFLEIGKADIFTKSELKKLREDVAYFPFDLAEICRDNPDLIRSMFAKIMPLFESSKLKPLPQKIYSLESVENAFRYMAQAKHIGKVIVSHEDYDRKKAQIKADASYLITGGLGNLGLQVARWLVEKGAKHLVLIGRKAPTFATQIKLDRLKALGAEITVMQTDVSQSDEVGRLFNKIKDDLPPLKGIIHAAGILDDGVLLQQNWQRFTKVMSPKVTGTWNLHLHSQNIPLDFFVCFSSIASLLGVPGQANYAAANGFLDALAHYRRNLGLPSLTINWGPWSNTNMISEADNRFAAQGITTINLEEGLEIFEQLLQADPIQIGVLLIDWVKYIKLFLSNRNFPFLKEIFKTTQLKRSTSELESSRQDLQLLQVLQQAKEGDRDFLLANYIRQQTAQIVGLKPSQISSQDSLSDLGLDSLMAIELRNQIMNQLKIELPIEKLIEGATIEKLTDISLEFLDFDTKIS